MTPPEPQKDINESDDRSRTLNRDKTKYRAQQTSSTHESPYWGSYSYGLRDNYGYGQKEYDETPTYDREREAGYLQSEYYYPNMRESGWGCEPSFQLPQPGYKRALMDPSLALGIAVAGAIATYVLYTAIPTAIPGRKRSGDVIDSPETFQDWFWSGKK